MALAKLGLVVSLAALAAQAVPLTTTPSQPRHLSERQIERNDLDSRDLLPVLSDLPGLPGLSSFLADIIPAPTPSSVPEAMSKIQAIYSASPTNMIAVAASMVAAGLTPGPAFPPALGEDSPRCDSAPQPSNPDPSSRSGSSTSKPIYPSASPADAPYDIPEATLRSALFLPANFTYGAIPPVLFVPGTGVTACEVYAHNLGKLLLGSTYADPAFLNIPAYNLGDAQDNAEYVAYAIHYLAALTARNVSVVTFSAGSLETAWALKYWPSAQPLVANLIDISPDYHGTTIVPLLCPPGTPCAPLFLQNNYPSRFIATLRANNTGSSAFVPTTIVYSSFDEIVVPQSGANASARLQDVRGVGVLNAETQALCPVPLAAGDPDSGHEDTLWNPLAIMLARDALLNGGPAVPSRAGIDTSICNLFMAPGLDLSDLLCTQTLLPLAASRLGSYANKVDQEPPIKAYAAGSGNYSR